jgi:hypothetical protein
VLDRCRRLTDNPYYKSVQQQDEMRSYVDEVESLLRRRGATLELDGGLPAYRLADMVDGLITGAA